MRGGGSGSPAGVADAAPDDGHDENGFDVLQSGCRRCSQRTDSQRDRCFGRRDGAHHRPYVRTVPDAEQVEGSGHVESAGTVRQDPLLGGVASDAGKHSEPLHLAGCRHGAALRPDPSTEYFGQSLRRSYAPADPRRADPNGRRIFMPRRDPHGRHLPRRHDALRRRPCRRGPGRRCRLTRHYGESAEHRFRDRPHEDRNPGAARRPDDQFQNSRTPIRRRKTRQILLFARNRARKGSDALFPGLHVARSACHSPHGIRPFAALQRHDPRHRTALLPLDRGQTADLCRQGAAPALPRTRGTLDPRILPERILFVAAVGGAVGGAAPDRRAGKRSYFPSRIRHRIRLFPAHATPPFARNQTRFGTLLRRTGQRNDRL